MPVRCAVRSGAYFDSVVLMGIAAELGRQPGVRAAGLVMATPANRDVLTEDGLLGPGAEIAGPNDLVIAVDADEERLDAVIAAADEALARRAPPPPAQGGAPLRPRALAQVPEA